MEQEEKEDEKEASAPYIQAMSNVTIQKKGEGVEYGLIKV
jgi:hypothetical protein